MGNTNIIEKLSIGGANGTIRLLSALLAVLVVSTSGQASNTDSNGDKDKKDKDKKEAPVNNETCIVNLGGEPTPEGTTSTKASTPPKGRSKALQPKKSSPQLPAGANTDAPVALSVGNRVAFQLTDFLSPDPKRNLALLHPFTVMNAAETQYALMSSLPAREAVDPLYRVRPIVIHPALAGESEASGGRMVIGQEDTIHAFYQFVGSIARGDRSGKAVGFPGPAGTGKTELLYAVANLEKNLGKQDKYRKWSYRFKGLESIPKLQGLFRRDRETGKLLSDFIDPDMPRSPFTLLREDMQEEVIRDVFPRIRAKWGMTLSKGWTIPEPKSEEIMKAIFQHEFPEISQGLAEVSDLTPEQYLNTLSKYVVIVPQSLLVSKREAGIIRAQTDSPNWQALFAAPNLARAAVYGYDSPLAIDYKGQIFQQDGGLLMFDELYRNSKELLNVALEIVQNRIAQTDFGSPVSLDIVPVWNANDESIADASAEQALKASLDRAERHPMRLLLAPNQIEAVSLFHVDVRRFKMRRLDENTIHPLNYAEVYPAPDRLGKTESSYGRYALYYDNGGSDVLIAPHTLNYLAWLTSATRFVTNRSKLENFKGELNLVTGNPALFTDPINRLRIALGDRTVELAERIELSRVVNLLREGESGISSRDIESWFKAALNSASESGKGYLTPRMIDNAFQQLLERGTITPPNSASRAEWSNLRTRVKMELLLPRMAQDVKAIISGDGQKSERVYAEVEREFIELASRPKATHVVPDDGSAQVVINTKRLAAIKGIYRKKFGREFSPNFLLRQLRGARQGDGSQRDGQLLEAIREFLAQQDELTSDYISAFDSMYRGETTDPSIVEKAGQIESRLHLFGYDVDSFREAVAFVAQLRSEKLLVNGSPDER
jgi:predicted Ser/Thr protein kinase